MTTTLNTASPKAAIRAVSRFWIMVGIFALFGLVICTVMSVMHPVDLPSEAQLVGP